MPRAILKTRTNVHRSRTPEEPRHELLSWGQTAGWGSKAPWTQLMLTPNLHEAPPGHACQSENSIKSVRQVQRCPFCDPAAKTGFTEIGNPCISSALLTQIRGSLCQAFLEQIKENGLHTLMAHICRPRVCGGTRLSPSLSASGWTVPGGPSGLGINGVWETHLSSLPDFLKQWHNPNSRPSLLTLNYFLYLTTVPTYMNYFYTYMCVCIYLL